MASLRRRRHPPALCPRAVLRLTLATMSQDGAGDPGATRRVRLTVAYDGSGFRGFARNPGVRTVMGDLGEAVATIVRRPVELTGAGRTDAGVHAWGQVVSGLIPDDTDLGRLQRSLNGLCRPD